MTAPARESKQYTGVITDPMCGRDHKGMNVAPESKCVKECVGNGKTYKFALLTGDKVYTSSNQETPSQFAPQRVVVKGVLYEKTGVLKVESIGNAK